MVAGVGKPLRIALRLDGGAADYEIHHPDAGTELVVCGDCGFEWDAAHTVTDDDGRVGYECPRCILKLFVEARQRVIEETVRDGAKQLAARLRLEVAGYVRQRDGAQAALARIMAQPGDPTVRHVVAWMRATYPMNQHAVEWADEIDHVFLGAPRKEGTRQHHDACMCFDCIAYKAAAVRRQGIVLQGWTCACGIFNGAEKEFLPLCRACGLERP